MSNAAIEHFPPTPPSEPVNHGHNEASGQEMASSSHQHIWVITGPAGCGKTSVADHLHDTFGMPYLEGDTFHTPENVAKMAAGHPLTDTDRWDWLIILREKALETLQSTASPSNHVVVTCSALKRKYRDVVRVACYHHPNVRVHFIFLRASETLLMDRVRARQNHYMKDYMVHSQFESLEVPQKDEVDVLSVDASGTSADVQKLAEVVVQKVLTVDSTSKHQQSNA